jgi:hypothetical protein
MTDITAEDFENVSLFAHHIGLKALFDVLAQHQPTLAADVAMELTQAQAALPQIMRADLAGHVQSNLQAWIDRLQQNTPPIPSNHQQPN